MLVVQPFDVASGTATVFEDIFNSHDSSSSRQGFSGQLENLRREKVHGTAVLSL